MNSHRAPYALLLAAAVVLVALPLAAPAPAAADDSGLFSGQIVIGYRSVDTGGQEAKYKEDFNLQDGPRLFGLDFHFTPSPELRAFADRIDLEINNFGGDPFESLHLGVQKFGAFHFRYDRTKSTYFYADQLIPPELRERPGGQRRRLPHLRLRPRPRHRQAGHRRRQAGQGQLRFRSLHQDRQQHHHPRPPTRRVRARQADQRVAQRLLRRRAVRLGQGDPGPPGGRPGLLQRLRDLPPRSLRRARPSPPATASWTSTSSTSRTTTTASSTPCASWRTPIRACRSGCRGACRTSTSTSPPTRTRRG